MSKSKQPEPPPSDPVRPSQLPEPREPSVGVIPAEAELPQEEYEEYDENAPQYYDENGQPYYDENGQPYLDENGQPYDPNYVTPDQAYATAPMQPMPQMHQMPMHQVPMHPAMLHPHPQHVPMPAPPPSHPYRVAPDAQPVFPGFAPARPPRPILGSALAVYGVLLWSFVVAGQFATSWITGAPMSQGTAAFLVFVATGSAWGFALHRSRHALPSETMGRFVWRGVIIGALAFLFFIVSIIIATIFGQATHGHDFLIAFSLVALSLAGIIMGPRLTLPARPERTHRARFVVVSMWIVGVILTFVAGAELATNG